jgi:hypothetical protein
MSKFKEFLELVSEAGDMKKGREKGLTKLENGLFDSIEFCLGLLGTVPVPIFIVNSEDEVIMLNSPHFDALEKTFCCSHCENSSNWSLNEDSKCIFCETIRQAREKGGKVVRKGTWRISSGDSDKELIVLVHASPVTIEDEKFVFVALENLTEVEQLKGLLPICMECSKIFDDETSDWVRIDEFVTEKSPAKFSHGLCPECSQRLMDDIENNS